MHMKTYTPAGERFVAKSGKLLYKPTDLDKARMAASATEQDRKAAKRADSAWRSFANYNPLHRAYA